MALATPVIRDSKHAFYCNNSNVVIQSLSTPENVCVIGSSVGQRLMSICALPVVNNTTIVLASGDGKIVEIFSVTFGDTITGSHIGTLGPALTKCVYHISAVAFTPSKSDPTPATPADSFYILTSDHSGDISTNGPISVATASDAAALAALETSPWAIVSRHVGCVVAAATAILPRITPTAPLVSSSTAPFAPHPGVPLVVTGDRDEKVRVGALALATVPAGLDVDECAPLANHTAADGASVAAGTYAGVPTTRPRVARVHDFYVAPSAVTALSWTPVAGAAGAPGAAVIAVGSLDGTIALRCARSGAEVAAARVGGADDASGDVTTAAVAGQAATAGNSAREKALALRARGGQDAPGGGLGLASAAVIKGSAVPLARCPYPTSVAAAATGEGTVRCVATLRSGAPANFPPLRAIGSWGSGNADSDDDGKAAPSPAKRKRSKGGRGDAEVPAQAPPGSGWEDASSGPQACAPSGAPLSTIDGADGVSIALVEFDVVVTDGVVSAKADSAPRVAIVACRDSAGALVDVAGIALAADGGSLLALAQSSLYVKPGSTAGSAFSKDGLYTADLAAAIAAAGGAAVSWAADKPPAHAALPLEFVGTAGSAGKAKAGLHGLAIEVHAARTRIIGAVARAAQAAAPKDTAAE